MGGEDEKKFEGFSKDENGVFRIADVNDRKCTDFFCVLAFIIFWVGMIIVWIVSAGNANYDYISKGYQFDGKICGLDGDLGVGAEYKNLYIPGVWIDGSLTTYNLPTNASICVKECPTADNLGKYEGKFYDEGSKSMKDFTGQAMGATTSTVLGTVPVCSQIGNITVSGDTTAQAESGLRLALEGVVNGAGVIAIGCVFILVGILIFNTCMRYCGGIIIWAVIISILTFLTISGVFFFSLANGDDITADQKNGYQAAGIICFVLALIWAIVICVSRNAIATAIMIMEETTHAVTELKGMYLLPIFKTFLVFILLIYWIAVSGNLACNGTMEPVVNANHTEGYNFGAGVVKEKEMKYSDEVMYMFYYHFFGYLWTMQLFIALMHFTIASSVAQWYFAPRVNGQKELGSTVWTAFKLSWVKHLGTMIFGSLVVAIAEAIRMMIDYLTEQMEKQSPNNPATKFLVCLLRCCARCIENCLKYITKNAYIFTAMFGYGFCNACYKLFSFLGNAPLTITMAQSLGGIIIKLGRGFVIVFSLCCTFALMTYVDPWKSSVSSPYLVLVVVFILALVIATIFFEVFGMSMNTLIMCFIADSNMNGGSPVNCGDGMSEKMKKVQEENQGKIDAREKGKATPNAAYAAPDK